MHCCAINLNALEQISVKLGPVVMCQMSAQPETLNIVYYLHVFSLLCLVYHNNYL